MVNAQGKRHRAAPAPHGTHPAPTPCAGTHWDALGRGGPGLDRGRACRWGHYFLFVFLFLCWKNKQGSGFLQSHCSSQTARRIQPALLNWHRARGRGARGTGHPSARGWAAEQTLLLLQLVQISVPWSPRERWLWVCVDFPCSFPRFRAVPPLTHGATSSSQPHVG